MLIDTPFGLIMGFYESTRKFLNVESYKPYKYRSFITPVTLTHFQIKAIYGGYMITPLTTGFLGPHLFTTPPGISQAAEFGKTAKSPISKTPGIDHGSRC